jgi:methionine-rich copper-binding protein CopC
MNPDRHIYLTTAVLAVVLAAAISVLTPHDPFAGTTVHRETASESRTAQAAPATTEASANDAAHRERTSL